MPNRNAYTYLRQVLSIKAPICKEPNVHKLSGKWINCGKKKSYNRILYSNENQRTQLYAIKWINLTDIMWHERKQMLEGILSCVIPRIYSLKTSKIIPLELQFRVVATLSGTVAGRCQMWDLGGWTGTVLYLDLGGGYMTWWKFTELYTSDNCTFCMYIIFQWRQLKNTLYH